MLSCNFVQTACLLLATCGTGSAFSRPWEKYIVAPSSRTPAPVAVHAIVGNAHVAGPPGQYVLHLAAGSRVSLDFGVEVGGYLAFDVQAPPHSADELALLSLAFCESPSFVGPLSDDTGAVYTMDWDRALNVSTADCAAGAGAVTLSYRTPPERFRGGFRFVTFNAYTDVTVSQVRCEIGFAHNMADLRGSRAYFYTPDAHADVLNRIWYAGAYTVQTNIAPADTGRYLPQVRPGWAYNSSLGVAAPLLVDGAKRDRANWPGDLGISGPTAMLSLAAAGREALANSLATLFYYQNATTGAFPFAGPDTASFRAGSQSDTYHAWSLLAMHDYVLYAGDDAWLHSHWANITRGIDRIVAALDPATGLQNQTNANDWGRRGAGGFNAALNALAYRVLTVWAPFAVDRYQAALWTAAAAKLKVSYNAQLWDATAGLYRDNTTTTTTLHPQDGNALALWFNLTATAAQAAAVSRGLTGFWNPIGPVTPELPGAVSPFVSGLELLGHLHGARNATRALQLATRLWGYLLTGSTALPLAQLGGGTFVEGLTANGSLYYRAEDGYAYDAAYTSLSHGWSTAPTTALITGVLGLQPTGPGGQTWVLAPQLGGLSTVQAGFETGRGWFEATVSVKTIPPFGEQAVVIALTVPLGTTGSIVLPAGCAVVELNGRVFRHVETLVINALGEVEKLL
ncbi:alpha-L-rhamnosidase [Niveomyces insectorum RCEF 264]|uniref:Alpha-L-rhamnosidase n=1 Tax=Niveomyces insectorum RCEF 264 TaxID=1081102 RepID=A0A167QXQ6_9HYPO|nr:alpha-L-rhamnosidase [Niveomyces insectorum RCEF 264]